MDDVKCRCISSWTFLTDLRAWRVDTRLFDFRATFGGGADVIWIKVGFSWKLKVYEKQPETIYQRL